jgi:hypothetical protein
MYLSARRLVELRVTPQAQWNEPAQLPSGQPDGETLRRQQRNSKRRAREFRAVLDEVFDLFERQQRKSRRIGRVVRRHFRNVNPMMSGTFCERLDTVSRDLVLLPQFDRVSVSQVAQVDCCLLGSVYDDDTGEEVKEVSDAWVLQRYVTMGVKGIRGRVPIILPYALDWSVLGVLDGKVGGWQRLWMSCDGREWRTIEQQRGVVGYFPKLKAVEAEDIRRLEAVLALEIASEFFWHIYIERRGLSMKFFTGAPGVRELLHLRDVDGHRRSAVLHWVDEHERKLSSGKTSHVKAHIRGAEEFTWDDWNIRVVPAKHDLDHLPSGVLPPTNLEKFLEWRVTG